MGEDVDRFCAAMSRRGEKFVDIITGCEAPEGVGAWDVHIGVTSKAAWEGLS